MRVSDKDIESAIISALSAMTQGTTPTSTPIYDSYDEDDDSDEFYCEDVSDDDISDAILNDLKRRASQGANSCNFSKSDIFEDDLDVNEDGLDYSDYHKSSPFIVDIDISLDYETPTSSEEVAHNISMIADYFMSVIGSSIGFDRVVSFAVISNQIFINYVPFEVRFSQDLLIKLPIDLQNDLSHGIFGRVFNYKGLLYFPNLRMLHFDDTALVYNKVRPDLNVHKIFSQSYFFETFPMLQTLKIGNRVYNSFNAYTDNNLFQTYTKWGIIANTIGKAGNYLDSLAVNSFRRVIDSDTNILVKSVGVGVTGLGLLGAKTVKTAFTAGSYLTGVGKYLKGNLGNLKNALKD